MYKKIAKKIHHWTIPHENNGFLPHAVRHKTLATYSAILLSIKVLILVLSFFVFPSPAEFSTITIQHIIEISNKQRQENNLPLLKSSSILDLSAKYKAQDMLEKNYFAHTSPEKIKPWHWFKEVGYNYTYAGENLAMNFVEAEDVVTAWMNSPTHRENILSADYNEIGIAVVIGEIDGYQTTLVVQHFGKTFSSIAGEVFVPEVEKNITESEIKNISQPTQITQESAQQEVTLDDSNKNKTLSNIINIAEKIFFILLGFIILNLILTIIIRLEVQHKSIILHSLWVIFLSLAMIFLKFHFLENVGKLIIS